MTAANVDHTNLDNQPYGGIVHEDVMSKIWDISQIPLVLTSLCSKGTHHNQYVEYTQDDLGDPATDNAHIDGVDVDQDDSVLPDRVGNYTQTALKEIQISHRAESAKSFGNGGKLSYQIMQGQKRLRRDVEAQMSSAQASVKGDGTAVAGISAGIGAWIKTNAVGGVGFTAGGFNTGTGIIDAPTFGTAEALTETKVRDALESIYMEGGESVIMMARPKVIRGFSEYLFTSGARIATQTNDDTNGVSPMTAYGSVNVFVSDFGQVVKLVANRLQPVTSGADVSAAYFLDPQHLEQSFLRGYRTEPLAKTGLSEKRLISCDYSLLVLNEKSCAAIHDIDETAAVTT